MQILPAQIAGIAVLFTLLLLAPGVAHAESLAGTASSVASSASSAGSVSLRGSSDAISGSSESSQADEAVAAGDYRLTALAPVVDRPGDLRLYLTPVQASESARPFALNLPREALSDHPLASGDLIRVSERRYGLEFSRSESSKPFFLVVTDEWLQALQTRRLDR